MANWPSTLPNPSYGLSRQPVENVIRSNTDSGIVKVRRRVTRPLQTVRFQLELTDAQMSTLENFVVNTLKDTLSFSWTDWVTMTTVNYRFVRRPHFRREGYNNVIADCELEILP